MNYCFLYPGRNKFDQQYSVHDDDDAGDERKEEKLLLLFALNTCIVKRTTEWEKIKEIYFTS